MKRLLWVVAGVCLLSMGANADQKATREAGDWLFRIGGTYVAPKSDNSDVVDVDDAVSLTFNGTYMFTNHFGLELLAAMPFEHDITLKSDGSDVASTQQLPPTLTAQWHFSPIGRIIPYVGAGLNYTLFFDEETTGALTGSTLDLDPSWGLEGQAGFDISLGANWFVNLDVRYIQIETDAKLNGTGIGEVKIDPWTIGLNVGWVFR